jgi:hypothetical protein
MHPVAFVITEELMSGQLAARGGDGHVIHNR